MADPKAPTRILHITFNMGFGGTEQVIRQLVTNLDPARFQCEIACIDGEVGALGLNPGETMIGTVARLDAVKNQAMMIRATRSLRDQNHKVRLLLVGDGPERDALQALTEDMELEASVIFTGFQSQPADYLSLMDDFLLPSFTEGTSMTLLEAMSLGIPTVATRVGGTLEIVADSEVGILTESDNLDEFTGALKQLFEEPARREQMAGTAKQRFSERFSVAQMVQQYQRLYQAGTKS